MVEGGMHNILEIITQYLKLSSKSKFTTAEIVELTELCKQSVINNISRLVKAGYLIRHTYYSRTLKHQVVDYTINPEVLDIIKELMKK